MVEQEKSEQRFGPIRITDMVRFDRSPRLGKPYIKSLDGESLEEIARKAPKDVLCLTTYKIAEAFTYIGGENVTLTSPALGSKRFYIDSTVYGIKDLETLSAIQKFFIPIKRFKERGFVHVVRLRDGSWMEFIQGEGVISTKTQGSIKAMHLR